MKGNVINLNTLHLNSVRLNGIGKVQSVSLKGGSTEDPVFPPVEPPIEPEPTPTYTLSASVTNGKVSATRNGSAVNLPFTANEGDVIVVEVTPNDGYEFNGWNDGNTDNPRTIVVNEDITLNASCKEVFVPLPTYTLSASVVNGVISATLNGKAISLPYEANEGDVIVVSVEPNEGFSFEGWADGNTDNPRSITMQSDVTLSAECVAVVVKDYIQFADAEVERVLIANGVSSDGVGITMEDAAKVTNIASWFNGNTAIESFDELDYFTGVTSISSNAFNGCANLQKLIFRYAIPPTLGASAFANTSFPIYVPDASLEAYKTAVNWSAYADRIHPLSEIEGDNGVIKYDGLVGAYTFKGRSNEDADYDLVQDRSGNGNIMTIYWTNFGEKDSSLPDLLGNGYWNDMLWFNGSTYAKIALPNGLTTMTVISKRTVFNPGVGRVWTPLIGSGSAAGKGLFWMEYRESSSQEISQFNGKRFVIGKAESPIVWMNNTYYNGHLLTGTEGADIHDGTIYLNRFRGDIAGSNPLQMTCLYIFNRELAPAEIETFIKAHIDADYVLPTIEQ